MKRSEINRIIQDSIELIKRNNIWLPAFAYWTMEEWRKHKNEIENLKKAMLGWDVFDYNMGEFEKFGGALFTLRNGHPEDSSIGTPYCEKIMILRHQHSQSLLMHFHRVKTEDIINRCNGIMEIQLYNSTSDDKLDVKTPVSVKMDGFIKTVPAGSILSLEPGSSITLTPGLYHKFWAKQGHGDVILGEVSAINDDKTDNIFCEPTTRFIPIEEDEPILYPLCNEYDTCL